MKVELIANRGLQIWIDGVLPTAPFEVEGDDGVLTVNMEGEPEEPVWIGGLNVSTIITDVPLMNPPDDPTIMPKIIKLVTNRGVLNFKVTRAITADSNGRPAKVTLHAGLEVEIDEISLYVRGETA